METMVSTTVRFCEFRNELLASLGQLHNPTFALAKLAEFKQDVAEIGQTAAIEKWQLWLKYGGHSE